MIVDLKKEDKAMQIVCMAIGSQHELIDKMEVIEGEGLLKEIHFTVGGVELDFLNVVRRINECYLESVTDRANALISDRFSNVINLLDNVETTIQDEISNLHNW